jgi:hypothetical protein
VSTPKRILVVLMAMVVATSIATFVPRTAEKAMAIDDGRDITWNWDGGTAAYDAMINAVRKRVGLSYINGVARLAGSATDYFSVNINMNRRPDWAGGIRVRVILRASDLYVQGVYIPRTNEYWYFTDAARRTYRPTARGSDNSLGFAGSYLGMERAANLELAKVNLNGANAATYLANIGSPSDVTYQNRARAMLYLVETIAEGARFDAVSNNLRDDITSAYNNYLNDRDVDLIKNWQVVGNLIVKKVNDPTNRDGITLGGVLIYTLYALAALVALIKS